MYSNKKILNSKLLFFLFLSSYNNQVFSMERNYNISDNVFKTFKVVKKNSMKSSITWITNIKHFRDKKC